MAVASGSWSGGQSLVTDKLKVTEKYHDPEALRLLAEAGLSSSLSNQCLTYAKKLTSADPAYDLIHDYVRNSQDHQFGVQVIDIVRVVRVGDLEFEHDPTKSAKFRMMLFHGTPVSNVASILQSGMKLPHLRRRPQLLGKAIYFADRSSKSAQYCRDTNVGSVGYLLLCDVLLGKMYTARKDHHNWTRCPSIKSSSGVTMECDSVKVHGRETPDQETQKMLSGSWVPVGPTVANKRFRNYFLRFNEFAVYSQDHIRIKYVVKVQFVAK